MSDELDVGNVSENDKSSISVQIGSSYFKLTTKNKKETIGKQMSLIARCKSVSKLNSAVSCCSNSGDGKLIVSSVARNNKTYSHDHETSSVYKTASENTMSSFSNKPILVKPSSVTKHDSSICSNATDDEIQKLNIKKVYLVVNLVHQ